MRILNALSMSLFLTTVGLASLSTAHAEPLDKIIAVVNEGIVTESQLNAELRVIEKQMAHAPQANRPNPRDLKKQVLDKIILDQLQLQFAQRTGIDVDDAGLDMMVSEIASRNNLTLEGLQEALVKEGMDYKQFRESMKQQNILNSLHQRDIMSEIQVSPHEVDQFLKTAEGQGMQGNQYRLSHILVSLSDAPSPDEIQKAQTKALELMTEIKQGKEFSEIALAESKGQHALSGGDLGWRALAEIPTLFIEEVPTMQVNDLRGPIRSPSGFHIIKLSDMRSTLSQAASIQKTMVRHILLKTNALLSDAEAQLKLRDLKREIAEGKDFGTLAKTYSEDLGTANQGGSLGWVTEGQLVPEFSKVMTSIALNTVSDPFKSPFGWHILQVQERKEEKNSKAIQRQQAENMIRNRKAEEKLDGWLRQMREEAYVKIYIEGFDTPNA